MDSNATLEVCSKAADFHASPLRPSRSTAVSAIRASRGSSRGVEASFPKFTGLGSLHALSRQSSPVSRISPLLDSDGLQPHGATIANSPWQVVVPSVRDCVRVSSNGEKTSETKHVVVCEPSSKSEKPTLPANFDRLTPRAKLRAVKQFLSAFEYKQTPETHFNTHKLRPLSRIMDTARMIIYSPQPIKCVEAVFLALYLTAGITDCDRIPLGFRTTLDGQVFQHIVLLVQYGDKFGAFGISRQPDLMNKDITFNSISDIVENYKKAYEAAGHCVSKIRVGLPVEHKIQSPNYVCWRHLSLSPGVQSWEECCKVLENHVLKKNRLWDLWLLAGKGGDPRRKSLAQKAALDTKLAGKDAVKKKKKKVKTQDITMKSLAEMKQVGHKLPVNNLGGRVSFEGTFAEARASKERKRNASRSAAKSLMKARILSNKTSYLIRQTAQYITPKMHQHRSLLHSRSSMSSSQGKRPSRVSFNLDLGQQGLKGETPRGKAQQVGGQILKGKEQQTGSGIQYHGKQQR